MRTFVYFLTSNIWPVPKEEIKWIENSRGNLLPIWRTRFLIFQRDLLIRHTRFLISQKGFQRFLASDFPLAKINVSYPTPLKVCFLAISGCSPTKTQSYKCKINRCLLSIALPEFWLSPKTTAVKCAWWFMPVFRRNLCELCVICFCLWANNTSTLVFLWMYVYVYVWLWMWVMDSGKVIYCSNFTQLFSIKKLVCFSGRQDLIPKVLENI